MGAGINLNPYQGLKQPSPASFCFGISRNQPKSLSGIETPKARSPPSIIPKAGINLNPYQGLKRGFKESLSAEVQPAGINLNPYQGLKLHSVPKNLGNHTRSHKKISKFY